MMFIYMIIRKIEAGSSTSIVCVKELLSLGKGRKRSDNFCHFDANSAF
jgi:hypothetical protein